MTWIDLADPLPRIAPEPYTPIEWELGETCSLPSTSGVPDRLFSEVIDARASHREFGLSMISSSVLFLAGLQNARRGCFGTWFRSGASSCTVRRCDSPDPCCR